MIKLPRGEIELTRLSDGTRLRATRHDFGIRDLFDANGVAYKGYLEIFECDGILMRSEVDLELIETVDLSKADAFRLQEAVAVLEAGGFAL